MTAGELTEFAASVAGVTAKTWGGAAGAAAADLSGLWAAGAAQGWFGLGQDDALAAVLAALRELGRAACPLPLMDAFVAVRLLGADEKAAAQLASGELRIRVDSIEDMLITAGAAAALGRLEKAGIGIVSISGGACDIVADRAEDLGAQLPTIAAATRDALGEIMPDYGTVQNPLDVTGAAVIDPTIFTRAVGVMSRDPAVGVVGVVNGVPWFDDGRPYVAQRLVDAIGAGMTEAACPTVYINQVMQPITGYTRTIMAQAGVPYVIPGLRQAVVALRNVAWWSSVTGDATGSAPATAPVTGVPDAALRRGQWSENAVRRLLLDAGVPVVPARLVTSGDDAVKAAAEFGGPVCLKVVSPQILHKTDIGGVRLDVPADKDAVLAAFTGITAAAARVDGASVEGVLVSPMRKGGTELLVGVVRDPHWGPMLAVAIGGVLVEVLKDSALAPLPVTPGQARALLDKLRGRAVLDGVRGAAPADRDALAAVIARVGDLALALGDDLESLEINPLRVDGAAVEALDAVVTWARKDND
jgi:acetate---CoA ligase (ADP-forming)